MDLYQKAVQAIERAIHTKPQMAEAVGSVGGGGGLLVASLSDIESMAHTYGVITGAFVMTIYAIKKTIDLYRYIKNGK